MTSLEEQINNLSEQIKETSKQFKQQLNETYYENGMMWMNGPITCTKNAIKLFTRAANN